MPEEERPGRREDVPVHPPPGNRLNRHRASVMTDEVQHVVWPVPVPRAPTHPCFFSPLPLWFPPQEEKKRRHSAIEAEKKRPNPKKLYPHLPNASQEMWNAVFGRFSSRKEETTTQGGGGEEVVVVDNDTSFVGSMKQREHFSAYKSSIVVLRHGEFSARSTPAFETRSTLQYRD